MELIRLEEGTLVIAKNMINAIKNFELEKKEIEKQEDKLKEKLIEAMRKYNKTKWESPDGSLKISYTPASEMTRFDSKRFEEEHKDLYWEYLKTSKRKESIRITVKDVQEVEK